MTNECNDKGAEKHLMWSMHRCNEPKRKYEIGVEERRRKVIRHNAHTIGFEDWKRATDVQIGAGWGADAGCAAHDAGAHHGASTPTLLHIITGRFSTPIPLQYIGKPYKGDYEDINHCHRRITS